MDERPRPDRVDYELRDYLQVLRRQWLLIAIITLVVTVLGLANSLRQDTVYQASAQVLLDTSYSQTVLFADATAQNVPDVDDQVTTEVSLMQSTSVNNTIGERVGYQPEVTLFVENPEDDTTLTRLVDVTAEAGTASDAAEEANDFAQTYTEVRKELISQDLEDNIGEYRASLDALDQSTAQSLQQIREIDRQLAAGASGPEADVLQARRDRLEQSTTAGVIGLRQENIQSRIQVLRVALENNEGRSIFRVNPAEVPTAPIAPRPARDGIVAFLVGLGLAIAAAFLRDYYDDSIRTKDDLDRITAGIPVLGIIPAVRDWRNQKAAVLESVIHPGSAASEAYRSLRTSLEFQGVGHEMALVHITSSSSGEGKSATSANLAVGLARAGHDVVLVDCDLRRPRVHEFFGLDNSVGFSTTLLGSIPIDRALQPVDDVPGLFVLPSGPKPPNPAELLSSAIARSHLRLLATTADYVIIDSPPLLPVTDSVILASYADTTIIVVKAQATNRRSINRTLELLEQVDAPVAGMVLNQVQQEATYGYGYGYGDVGDYHAFTEQASPTGSPSGNGQGHDGRGSNGSKGSPGRVAADREPDEASPKKDA